MVAPCSMIAFYLVGMLIYLTVNPMTFDVLDVLHNMVTPYMVYSLKMASVQWQQRGSCECPPAAKTRAQARIGKDAVMVLGLRERIEYLNETLQLFYKNFNRCFRKDIVVIHNGDFKPEDQKEIIAHTGPEVKFHLLLEGGKWWGPPDSIKHRMHEVNTGHWAIGFFHMTRWYAILAHEYLQAFGYEWYMRMDDDSFFLSCIDYDIFDFADSHNITYAYRMEHTDDGSGPFTDVIQEVMDEWGVPIPPKLLDHFEGRVFQYERWDGRHFYNNFCLTKIGFWTSPGMRYILRKIDDSGFQYMRRILDAPLQSVLVELLLPKPQIYKFTDWSYSHHPKMVVTFYSVLPPSMQAVMEFLGIPDFEATFGLQHGKQIRFFLDVQKVFGKGSRWYKALRR